MFILIFYNGVAIIIGKFLFAETHTQTQLISEEIKFCSIDLANIPPSKILCSCNICYESVLFMRVILARENSGILMWPDQVH